MPVIAPSTINRAPTATSGQLTLLENSTVTLLASNFGFSDDKNSLLNLIITSLPTNGVLTYNGSPVVLTSGSFVVGAGDISKLVFTPAANYSGSLSFNYKLQDNGGTANGGVDTSSTATLTLNVSHVNQLPVGSVVISGTATQNETLTASNTLADVDGMGVVSYQWQANGTNIEGATSSTLVLGETLVGKTISVVASYTDGFNTHESKASLATAPVVNVNDAPTGNVVISGSAVQNAVLTASNTLADLDGLGAISYQWQANGQNIDGATGNTLTLAEAQVGKTITVVASYTDGHGTHESKTSLASAPVANVNDAPTGNVVISGNAVQNAVLTASNTLGDLDGLGVISYQWQADGVAIEGATGNTLTLAEAQVGKSISVVASYTDGHGTHESKTSAATVAVANVNDLPTGSVTISGTVAQNEVLTASNTLADVDGLGVISYQWQADGVAIEGATSNTLTLAEAQVGKSISVVASYTDGHDTHESKTSAATVAVANVNDAPTGSVTISGTVAQNEVLTAVSTLADVDGLGVISYQWQADGQNIDGATGATLALAEAQVGKTITVVASYTDGHGTHESKTSVASAPVANVNDAPTVLHPLTFGQNAVEGTAFSFIVPGNTFADVDSGDTQTLSATLLNGDPLPSWLHFNAATGMFSGTPGSTDGADIVVKVTATDSGNLSASSNFILHTSVAPVLTQDQVAAPAVVGHNQSVTLAVGAAILELGDSYSVQIGNDLAITVAVEDETMSISDVVFALTNQLQQHYGSQFAVTTNNGVITLTANTAAAPVSIVAHGLNVTAGVNDQAVGNVTAVTGSTAVNAQQQHSTVTFSAQGGVLDIGDQLSVVVNGKPYSVEADSANYSMLSALFVLVHQINTDSHSAVSASWDVASNTINLYAKQSGTSFTVDASTSNAVAGLDDVTVVTHNTQDNVVHVAAVAQVENFDFGTASFQPNETVTITLNGHDYTYTVQPGDTVTTIANGVAALLPNTVAAHYDVASHTLSLTAANAGTPFTASASVVNINFTTNSNATVATTAATAAIAQSSSLSLGNVTYDHGDAVSVVVTTAGLPHIFGHTVAADSDSVGAVLLDLVTQINTAALGVTASIVNGALALVANTAGTAGAFSVSASVVNHVYTNNADVSAVTTHAASGGVDAVAQVSSVSFSDLSVQNGEVYSLTIANTTYSVTAVTGSTLTGIVSALRGKIAADSNAAVTVVRSGTTLYLTAKEAGAEVSISGNDGVEHSVVVSPLVSSSAAVPAVNQTSTITIADSYDVGDVVTLKIGADTVASHTVVTGDTAASIAHALANANTSLQVGASDLNGVITLSALTANQPFTASAVISNASGSSNVAGSQVDAVVAHNATAQSSTVTFNDHYDIGDTVTLTVGQQTYTVVVTSGHTSAADVAQAFAVQNIAGFAAQVNNGVLTLTDNTAGQTVAISSGVVDAGNTVNSIALDHTTSAAQAVTARAEIVKLTVSDVAVDAGDSYTLTLGNTTVDYQAVAGDTAATVAAALRTLATGLLGNTVTVSGTGSDIVLTAKTAGAVIAPTLDVANAPAGAHADNAVSTVVTTANAVVTPQVTTVTLPAGAQDLGDKIVVAVNGQSITFTVTDPANLLTNLAAAINADNALKLLVSASVVSGNLVLTQLHAIDGQQVVAVTMNTDLSGTSDLAVADAATTAGVMVHPQVTTLDYGTVVAGDTLVVVIDLEERSVVVAPSETLTDALGRLASLVTTATATVTGGKLVVTAADTTSAPMVLGAVNAATLHAPLSLTAAGGDTAPLAATKQVTSVTLNNGALDEGDSVTVTIAGHAVNHVVSHAEQGNMTQVLNALAAAVNADVSAGALVLASVDAVNGKLVLTEKTAASGVIAVTQAVADESRTLTAGTTGTPDTAGHATVAQVSTVTLVDTFDAGETVTINVGATQYTSVNLSGKTASQAADLLVSQINGDNSAKVTATQSNGVITLTQKAADVTNGALSVTSSVDHQSVSHNNTAITAITTAAAAAQSATSQVSSVTLGATSFANNDTFTVTVNGHAYTATATTSSTVVSILNSLKNQIAAVEPGLNVLRSGSTLLLSSKVLGTAGAFTVAAADTAANAALSLGTTTAATDAANAAQEVSDINLGSAQYDNGDAVIVVINGHSFRADVSVADSAASTVVDSLYNAIVAAQDSAYVVSKSLDGTHLIVTATAANTALNVSSAVQNSNLHVNTATAAQVTANTALATAQVSTYALDGNPAAGDVVKITVNGTDYTATAVHGDTSATLLAKLATAVGTAAGSIASATVAGGELVLTGKADGSSFSSATPTVTLATLHAGSASSHEDTANISTGTAQVTHLAAITGTPDVGEVVSFHFNNQTVRYTVQEGDLPQTVADGLKAAFVALGNTGVTLDTTNAALTFTGNAVGDAFTVDALTVTAAPSGTTAAAVKTEVSNAASATAATHALHLTANMVLPGDSLSVTVNGHEATAFVAVGDSLNDLGGKIVTAINTLLGADGSAVYSNGMLTITGKADGSALTVSDSVHHTTAVAADLSHVLAVTTVNTSVAVAQVTTISYDNTPAVLDAGDTYTVTVNGHSTAYVAQADDAASDVLAILVDQINAAGWGVTASINNGQLRLTADVAGTAFTASASGVNSAAGAHANTAAGSVVVQDSVPAASAIAQVDSLNFGAAGYNTGDVVTVTVAGNAYHYTVLAETPAASVVAAMVSQINAADHTVVASVVNGLLTLTARTAGVAFSTSVQVDNVQAVDNHVTQGAGTANGTDIAAHAQATTLSVSGTVEIGDVYTLTIDQDGAGVAAPVTVTHTVSVAESIVDVLTQLVGDSQLANVLGQGHALSYSIDQGVLTLTANTAGTPFTASLAATNRPAGAHDKSVSVATPVANVEAKAAVVQHTTVTLAGTFEAGDSYTVTVDHDGNLLTTGDQVVATHQVAYGEALGDVLGDLLSQLNAASGVTGVSAVLGGDNLSSLLLTGAADGTAFTVAGTTANRVAGQHDNSVVQTTVVAGQAAVDAVHQHSTLSLANSNLVAGDTVDLLLNNTHFSYTVHANDTHAMIAQAIAAAVNNVNDNFTAVTAAVSQNGEQVTLVGVDTTAFTASVDLHHGLV